MVRTIAACVVLSIVVPWGSVHPDVPSRASVIDGDTVEMSGERIRLHGIDAPESEQLCRAGGTSWRCGRQASRALAGRVDGHLVVCEERDRDRYGRIVALCRVEGRDLGAWLVSQGWALAYRRYSADYVKEEATARAARRGLWRGKFVPPWDWRRGVRLPSTHPSPAPEEERTRGRADGRDHGACRIKGNIGSNGTRIYHVPGGQYYERTRIDPAKGERWFCSEAEARSAGWRRSRR